MRNLYFYTLYLRANLYDKLFVTDDGAVKISYQYLKQLVNFFRWNVFEEFLHASMHVNRIITYDWPARNDEVVFNWNAEHKSYTIDE